MGLHHATHATLSHRHSRSFILRLVTDKAFSSEEHACYRSSILKSNTLYLSWIDNASCTQIFINILASVVAKVTFALANLLNNYSTFATSVLYNLTKWFLYGTTYDVDTSLLVCIIALDRKSVV